MNTQPGISPRAFHWLCSLFRDASGIALTPDKTALVASRLRRRVDALGLSTFDEYCRFLESDESAEERQAAIDLLTTNETYFYREPAHFSLLSKLAEQRSGQPLRVWSAACSTGEEPFSIAMTLHERIPMGDWSVLGTDLSTRALDIARQAVYPMTRLDNLPQGHLKRYFLRGVREYAGSIRVCEELRKRVELGQHNLLVDMLSTHPFDVIFLRNVLIYFDPARKLEIVARLARKLRVGGHLFLGHAEPLGGPVSSLRRVDSSVYQRIS